MSTVKATNLQHASSSSVNAVTTSGGDLTNAAGVSFMSANKNLLYNGAMQVAQRGTSTASITSTNYYTADRWYVNPVSFGTWTNSVENDAPTGSGLRKSLKMLCTTADAAPAASDELSIGQKLEGLDLQRIAKGTASAQQITLSFWVKSNVTGTYVALLYDDDNARSVSAAYTISASATWEKKSVTFPADTTGAFDNDNANSLTVIWILGAGSNLTAGTLRTTWGSHTASGTATGQTNLAAATNNYWQVTGTQLEIGPVATSFEFKSYGQELRECQRYYVRYTKNGDGDAYDFSSGYATSTTICDQRVPFPTFMRAAPSAIDSNSIKVFRISSGGYATGGTVSLVSASNYGFTVRVTQGSASFTQAENLLVCSAAASGSYIGLSAEL